MSALKSPPAVIHFTKIGLDRPLASATPSTLIVDAQIDTGWHINSNHPSNPDYIGTQLEITPPQGVSVGGVEYPAAEKTKLAFSAEELSVFTGAIKFLVP